MGVRMAEWSKGPALLHSTRSSARCSVMMRGVGWSGEGSRGRRRVYLEPTHVVVQQKQTQLCRATILQLKENPMINHKKKIKVEFKTYQVKGFIFSPIYSSAMCL